MKTFFKILSVIFGLATLGHLINGGFFVIGFILAITFGFFGWRNGEDLEK
jgi:hypothetical protein